MEAPLTNPHAFISYSWTSKAHEDWVLEFAQRLMNDGISITLDKWDLKEGQDKHAFMEKMVNDPTITKVLIVCDSGYQAKGDSRTGGVGTESQLISKEVYENVGQEKFIPIVREYKDDKPCIPHYISSRIYIDLFNEETYEANYHRLARNLYGSPELKKPTLGTAPSYITQEISPAIKTAYKVGEIKAALIAERKSANGLINDYLELFFSSLEEFRLRLDQNSTTFDQVVVDSIENMQSLVNDFIDFSTVLFKYKTDVDLDQLTEFFEQLLQYQQRPEHITQWFDELFDNFRFVCYQLMLNYIALLIKQKKFIEAGYFINTQYFFKDVSRQETAPVGIEQFSRVANSLEETRNRRLNLNLISVTGTLLREKSIRTDITFEDIRKADLIIYYSTLLKKSRWVWFPKTSVYNAYGINLEIFTKMASRRFFEKVKGLFEVDSIDEFKHKVNEYINSLNEGVGSEYRIWQFNIPALENVLKLDNIGTLP